MAAGVLSTWLAGESERLVWIEFDAYARQVFAGGTDEWLSVANTFVAGVSQAQDVVRTEVLSIDALAPCVAALAADAAAPAAAAQAALDLDAPRRFGAAVTDALAHRFAGHIDIVLKIGSPAALLRAAGLAGEPAFDDLDDIGIGLSNLLRDYATKPLAVVLVACPGSPSADES